MLGIKKKVKYFFASCGSFHIVDGILFMAKDRDDTSV
jgi:hypothetical protein